MYAATQIGAQMRPWHDGGYFMGMHWIWWPVWILTVIAILALRSGRVTLP